MPSRNGHRPRRGVKKRTVEQRVNAKRATAHKHIPDRGEVDPHDGSTWDGIGKMKLKYRDLDNDNHSDNSVNGRVIAPSSIDGGHINGRLGAGVLPADMAVKGDVINKAKDLGWGDGNKYIPDGALSKDYAAKDSVDAIKQQITGFQTQVKNLKKQIQQLSQGKKKN